MYLKGINCFSDFKLLCPNFSLIYFDHFLLWPSTRCTSQGVPLRGDAEKSAFTSYLTVYKEEFCSHIKQHAFTWKTQISELIFPHMVSTLSRRLESKIVQKVRQSQQVSSTQARVPCPLCYATRLAERERGFVDTGLEGQECRVERARGTTTLIYFLPAQHSVSL